MQVLVTGAAGHIGNNVVRELLRRGDTVRALVRSDSRALEGLDVERVSGDMQDPDSLQRSVEGCEGVVHTAAYVGLKFSEKEAMWRVNVEGTQSLLAASKAAGVRRFVHFSSIHALQQRPFDEPLDESRSLALSEEYHPYDQTKARAEEEVLGASSDGFGTVVVNPTAVLGPYDFKPSRLGRVVCLFRDGKMPAVVNSGFDWVDVRDVAFSAVNALKSTVTGERFLLGGKWRSIGELGGYAARWSGKKGPTMTVPLWLASVGAPFAEIWASIRGTEALFSRGSLHMLKEQNRDVVSTKAQEVLGHSARDLEETVRDTLNWFEGGHHHG